MNLRAITKREPLAVEAGVSKLARVEFARHPYPAFLKEPPHFQDEVLIANEAYVLTPPSPLKLGGGVLRNTVVIIMASLEKNPDRRPSMEQVAKVYADSASLVK